MASEDVEAFTDHINAVDKDITFTSEEAKEQPGLLGLHCGHMLRQVEVYRKPTHNNLFDSYHPLQHRLGVIRTFQQSPGGAQKGNGKRSDRSSAVCHRIVYFRITSPSHEGQNFLCFCPDVFLKPLSIRTNWILLKRGLKRTLRSWFSL